MVDGSFMRNSHLRVVGSDQPPSRVDETMAEVGGMLVAGLLGSYQANLDERDELLAEAMKLFEEGERTTARARDLWLSIERNQRRLWIYSMLTHEALS